jgi:hypothetical protein
VDFCRAGSGESQRKGMLEGGNGVDEAEFCGREEMEDEVGRI